MCEAGGWVRADIQTCLAGQEAVHEQHRERVLEQWNRSVMHNEDLASNRVRYASCGDRRGATASTRERRVCAILARWRRREARERLRAAALAQRER